jgi:putative aldouronate transport system substrate-binding protein
MWKKGSMWIRALMVLSMALLLAGGVFASGAKEAPKAVSAQETGLNLAGMLPIMKDKITLEVTAVKPGTVLDMATNYATKWLEDKTNIRLKWNIIPLKDSAQKVNLILATGTELPDVFLGCAIQPEQQFVAGTQGLFVPMNSLIETYGVNVRKLFQVDPMLRKVISAPDGNIYGLGVYSECFHCKYSQKMWINKTWLDKLALAMPKTTEEFRSVLRAFKTKDPNGNGKNDEIPLTAASSGWRGSIDGFLLNAFIYNDAENRLNLVDGKVVPAFAQPEWRDGLAWMSDLLKEGLLDSESFIQSPEQVKQLIEGDIVRVGASPGGSPANFALNTGEATKNFAALAPLTGPKGNSTTAYFPPRNWYGHGQFVITNRNKYPAASFRLADYMMSLETELTLTFGEENVDWRYATKGEVGVDGKPALFKEISMVRGVNGQNKAWTGMAPRYATRDTIEGRTTDPADIWYIERRLYEETVNKYVGHEPKDVLPPLAMQKEEASAYNEMKANINGYISESIARFVTGDRNVRGSDWDAYLTELEKMGLRKYIEMSQTFYNRQYK